MKLSGERTCCPVQLSIERLFNHRALLMEDVYVREEKDSVGR